MPSYRRATNSNGDRGLPALDFGRPPSPDYDRTGDLGINGYHRGAPYDDLEPDAAPRSNLGEGDESAPLADGEEWVMPLEHYRQGVGFTPVASTGRFRSKDSDVSSFTQVHEDDAKEDAAATASLAPSRYVPDERNSRRRRTEDGAHTSMRHKEKRRRIVLRWLQTISAVVVAGGSLGAIFHAKPTVTPPPAGSAALMHSASSLSCPS
ncbi:hypothetical protein JCM10908_001124 [Rhodotorula pacifica]|uniref:uncharacterized protein n=1 Tax=Rhodotorula pacifica TaxID=1495444 RepID=UPI003177CB74